MDRFKRLDNTGLMRQQPSGLLGFGHAMSKDITNGLFGIISWFHLLSVLNVMILPKNGTITIKSLIAGRAQSISNHFMLLSFQEVWLD